jgi:hypothetical protein
MGVLTGSLRVVLGIKLLNDGGKAPVLYINSGPLLTGTHIRQCLTSSRSSFFLKYAVQRTVLKTGHLIQSSAVSETEIARQRVDGGV